MNIERFEYVEDFTYYLKVEKNIKGNPYLVAYPLVNVISKRIVKENDYIALIKF